MNLYEAISLRKSHRNFLMEEIEPETLAEIGAFYEEAPSLFPGIKTEIGITDNTDGKHAPKGFFGVKAPYYLTMYSEKKDRYMMNAGCICEQLSLYMLTLGLGSCFLGSVSYKKDARTRGDMEFVRPSDKARSGGETSFHAGALQHSRGAEALDPEHSGGCQTGSVSL